MRILGIDPGIERTGWGTVDMQGSRVVVKNFGCIETSKRLSLEKRIEVLYDGVHEVINKEHPDEMSVEELFFNTNVKTALVVGQARGVVLLSASQYKIPLFEYTPLQVKIAVTGYGRAEKKQVEKMTMLQLKMGERPKLDDTTDALAIALTHAYSRKLKNLE